MSVRGHPSAGSSAAGGSSGQHVQGAAAQPSRAQRLTQRAWSTSAERAQLTRYASGRMRASRSALIRLVRLRREQRMQRHHVGDGEQLVELHQLGRGRGVAASTTGSAASTRIPSAWARQATARPMRPRPTMPSTEPVIRRPGASRWS